eukprot:507686-Rhodomonas_salina.1
MSGKQGEIKDRNSSCRRNGILVLCYFNCFWGWNRPVHGACEGRGEVAEAAPHREIKRITAHVWYTQYGACVSVGSHVGEDLRPRGRGFQVTWDRVGDHVGRDDRSRGRGLEVTWERVRGHLMSSSRKLTLRPPPSSSCPRLPDIA